MADVSGQSSSRGVATETTREGRSEASGRESCARVRARVRKISQDLLLSLRWPSVEDHWQRLPRMLSTEEMAGDSLFRPFLVPFPRNSVLAASLPRSRHGVFPTSPITRSDEEKRPAVSG
ncbi:hypothetical protein MRX96_014179 [Rhipicephalus microplus]